MALNNQISQKPDRQWPSVLQFVLSLSAAILLMGFGLTLGAFALVGLFVEGSEITAAGPGLIPAVGMLFAGLLLLPSAFYALSRLTAWNVRFPGCFAWAISNPWLFVALVPLALVLGYFISNLDLLLAVFLLPLAHIAVVGGSLLFLSYLGRRGIDAGSPQRQWGVLAAGIALGPLLALILELGALVVFSVIAVIYISSNPALVEEFEALAMKIALVGQSEELLIQTLTPYLARPGVILAILSMVSVVVPLIEEAVKPIGIWLLAGKRLSPAQGFSLGILSGVGFALYENVTIVVSGQEWAAMASGRIGSALLHILATGMVGWGLAKAWTQRRTFALAAAYLTAVLLHGLWNAGAVISGIWFLNVDSPLFEGVLGNPELLASLGLGGLAVIMFVSLLAWNRNLRRQSNIGLGSVNEYPLRSD